MNTITINFTICTPAPANGYRVSYKPVGSAIPYRVAPTNFTSSPAIIVDSNDPDGTQYEGYIESDCGGGNYGVQITFNTAGGSCASVTGLELVSVTDTTVTVNFNTVPNATAYSLIAVRVSDDTIVQTSTGGNPPRTISMLQPNTAYKIYVRTHCVGGTAGLINTFVNATTAISSSNYQIGYTNNNPALNITVYAGNNGESPSTTIYNGNYTSDPLTGTHPLLPLTNGIVVLAIGTDKTLINATLNGNPPNNISAHSATWINVYGGININFLTD